MKMGAGGGAVIDYAVQTVKQTEHLLLGIKATIHDYVKSIMFKFLFCYIFSFKLLYHAFLLSEKI